MLSREKRALVLERVNKINYERMEKEFEHKEIARKLAKTMAEKATEIELRRLYEETMFQQFISMDKNELFELLWHG